MRRVKIFLNSIEKVKNFEKDIQTLQCDADLISGRYIVDAKSIMGIFSLDLLRPMELVIRTDDDEYAESVLHSFEKYMI